MLAIDSQASVDELQDQIQNLFRIPKEKQIIRFIFLNFEVRVVPGFNLEFYEIGNNSTIDVQRLHFEQEKVKKIEEIIESDFQQDNQRKGDIYEQRLEMINTLLNPLQSTLNTIKEEDEDKEETEVTQEEKRIGTAKKLFFDVTRGKKTQDQREFLSIFRELEKESQMLVLGGLDNVGWTGIHYAILYNNQELLQDLLQIIQGEILDFVSNDGYSPLFLSVAQKNWDITRLFLKYARKE